MITVQEHLCRIVDTVMRLSPTGLDLLDAQGCVLIDMVKAVDRHARITDVRVTAKSGGRSGDWVEP